MSISQSKISWDKGDNDLLSRTLQEIRSEVTTISTNMLAMKTEMTGVNQNIDKLNDQIYSKIVYLLDMLQIENNQLKSRVMSLENQLDKIEAGSHSALELGKECADNVQIEHVQRVSGTEKCQSSARKQLMDLSETLACNSGVRQGCTLSPWLFAMYINELATEIENSGGNGIFAVTRTFITL
ncbi:unnamed protein product [Mytilus edulis]|uniref:Reverse transcriptase domain-containing protein n=1 Tax=Mytilus edulis TaxID=6550 RepID=A0A8S3S1D5_MYTED|nr:unnamed protein product [Mytilus edulis]